MATPSQLTQFAFAAGLDESQQDEVLDPLRAFPVLQNVRQDRRGGIGKRLGYGALSNGRVDGTSRTTGCRLFSHRGTPAVIDGAFLDSYIGEALLNATRSRVPEATYRLIGLPTPTSSATLYDVEACGGLLAVTYGLSLIGGNVYVALADATSGATIRSPEPLGSSAGMAVVGSFEHYFVAVVSTSSDITAYILDTQNIAAGWTTLATVLGSAPAHPALVCSLDDRVAVVYGVSSGTDRVVVKTFDETGLLQTRNIGTSSTTPSSVSIDGSTADTLWIAWSLASDNDVYALGVNASSLATTLASTAVVLSTFLNVDELAICAGTSPGTARVWALEATTPPSPYSMSTKDISTIGGVTTPGTFGSSVFNVLPASRPFCQAGRYYMACHPSAANTTGEVNDQALCIIADWTDNVRYVRPIGNLQPGLIITGLRTCKFARLSSTRRAFGFQAVRSGEKTAAAIAAGMSTVGCLLAEFDFGSRARWQVAFHAGNSFIGGSVLSVYDGERVTESGFLVRPSKPAVTSGLTGITGKFRYVAVYEDIDSSGNWVISGVSEPSDEINVTDKTISLATRTLTISARLGKGTTRVAWYRTGGDTGEGPFYRLGVSTNDLSLGSTTFSDSVTKEVLETHAQLFAPNLPGIDGGGLDRLAPAGLPLLVSYAGMLVGAKGSSVFFSGQEVYGEATWFNPAFEVPLEGDGDITALAAQDGTLFVFKRRSVYTLAGEAPSDNGAFGGLGSPRRLACDVGCIDPNSVVVTSAGIFFQSERGIELLNRGGAVQWVGEQVQGTLASYPVVSSAVLDDRNGLVRFSLAASEEGGFVTGEGRDVIFDLALGAWQSVDDKTGSSPHQASQDATMVYVGGSWRYAWLGTEGRIYYERLPTESSAHTDVGAWVTMAVETAWLKTAGIQGKQVVSHVLALARRHSHHQLSISLAYNYEQTFQTARVWTHTQISNLLTAGWPVTQLKHEPHDSNACQSVRVRIEDASPTVPAFSGKGSTWIALTLDITPKPGVFDVPEEAA